MKFIKLVKVSILILVVSMVAMMSAPIFADEISDQITMGLEAYKEQDYKTAVEELKFVTAQLQQLQQAEIEKLMPKALEGWTEKEQKGNNAAAIKKLKA